MIHFWHWLWLWFAIHTGTYNEPGPYYGFFSGFGSDLGEIALIGAVFQVYRKHNCHIKGCWRIAHYEFTDRENGDTYMLCRKHHPSIHKELTHDIVKFIHKRNKNVGSSKSA